MDVMDWVILTSLGVLVVFFASVTVLEWLARSERPSGRADAQIIPHPGSDQKASAA